VRRRITPPCFAEPGRNPPAAAALFPTDPKKEHAMAKVNPVSAPTSAGNPGPDWEQTSPVDPHPTWRPNAEQMEMNAPHRQVSELPPLGYPISEEAVTHWFQRTFNRTPEGAEVGVILDAMARRDAEQPATEPPFERVFLDR
jgi:hypothetical protein